MALEFSLLRENRTLRNMRRVLRAQMGALDVLHNYQSHFVKDCAHGFCTCPDTPLVPCDDCYLHDEFLSLMMRGARAQREGLLNSALATVDAYYSWEALSADIGKICVARHIGPELAQVVHAFLDEGMEKKCKEVTTFYNDELEIDAEMKMLMQLVSGDPDIQIRVELPAQTTTELRAQYREANSGPPPLRRRDCVDYRPILQ